MLPLPVSYRSRRSQPCYRPGLKRGFALNFNRRSLITLAVLTVIGGFVYYYLTRKGITYIWHWEKIPEMLFYHGAKSADDPTSRLRMGILMIGFVLTLKISLASIFFAIIIGTVVGIARLSHEPVTRVWPWPMSN